MTNAENRNKVIAKNTIYLYIRMALVMIVSLFTSRVLFNSLGDIDYGLNNLIAGVIMMFTYLNNSLSLSTSRYLSYAIGKQELTGLRSSFSNALFLHVILGVLVIILSETIGLWFVNTKLSIPTDRIETCNWVYQTVIASSFVTIIKVPFSSLIFSYEKMGFIAYLSIFEVIAKCIVAITIQNTSYDRLLLLSFLNLGVTLTLFIIYVIYCKSKFPSSLSFNLYPKLNIIRPMTSFTSWVFLGSTVIMLKKSGINTILNIFFGPVVNAANGIAYTINHTLYNFTSGFSGAVNPQIIKTFANKEYERNKKLIFSSTKISFFLVCFISLPLLFETEYILRLWLISYPPLSATFTRLLIIISIIELFSNSFGVAFQAHGDIKKLQIITSIWSFMILPTTYLLFKANFPPETAFVVTIIITATQYIPYSYFLKHLLNISPILFVKKVILPCATCLIINLIFPLIVCAFLNEGFIRFTINVIIIVLTNSLSTYTIGLDKSERKYLRDFITSKFCAKS